MGDILELHFFTNSDCWLFVLAGKQPEFLETTASSLTISFLLALLFLTQVVLPP